jgi:Fibronectin type III domain
MRRTRPGLLPTAGGVLAVLAVLTAGLAPAPASAADRGAHPARAAITSYDAIPADSVVDSYGVGIHLGFLNTPYADEAAVASALRNLGVRHVRDDLFLDAPWQYDAIRTVAERAGVGFDLIMGRPDRPGTPEDYVDTVATELPRGVVESLEGVNEWDHFGGDDWVTEMKSWQKRLYTAAKADPATADLPVLAPALAFRWNYAEAGDLSQHADLANAHMYPGGYPPSNQIRAITDALRGSIPDLPIVTTEAGYHNATETSNGHLPVPETVAGVYLPRLLLEHLLRGEQRVYSYELIDEFEDSGRTNPEANFGLLRHDLSHKPAYDAMKNLLGLLADPGPSFAPGSLALALDGLPSDGSTRAVLTQKRDGEFVLLLWRDVSIYDPSKQEPIQVTPADVTIRLDDVADWTVRRPTSGSGPVAQASGSSLTLQLGGEVTAVEIDPQRPELPPDPVEVTAARADRSATVSWDLPESPTAVTGFEVTRTPGDVVARVPGDVRTYQDTGLVNGTTYGYTVRALSADGSSAAVASPAVVPAGVPTRPRVLSARPGKRSVTVTWRSADPNGSPVTAYRLVSAGRTITVGPGRDRATIRRLPADRRVRVVVRARNAVGWGPRARTAYVVTHGG